MESLQKHLAECRQQICDQENIIDELQKKIAQFQEGNEEKSVEKCANCIEFMQKFEDLKSKYVEKEKLLDESQKEIARLKDTVAWLMQKEKPIPLMTSQTERLEIKKEVEESDGNIPEESDGNIPEESDGNIEKDSEKKFVCTFPGCPKVYKYKRSLKDHRRLSHPNETGPSETFPCEFPDCKLSFYSERSLNAHRKVHFKPFPCTVDGCNEGFGDKESLDEHLGTHGSKPFGCPLNCGKYFAKRSNLAYHMRAHSGQKPFECPHEGCGKTFSSASNCANHKLRVHDGARPFQCEFEGCGRRFPAKKDCVLHSYSHTGEKKFKCCICYGEYQSSNGLRKHMVKTHNVKSRQWKLDVV